MRTLILVCIAVGLCFAGCSYPVTKVNTVDSRPTLSFKGAPNASIVFIDGVSAGEAGQYNGKPKVLAVEPGTHEITIVENNTPIFNQSVFVESEHKEINVH